MQAATDLPSAIAEIKATLYQNAVGAITAVKLRQLLVDIVNVLDTIAISAGGTAGASTGAAAGQQAGAAAGAAAAVQFLTAGVQAAASSAGTAAGGAAGQQAGAAAGASAGANAATSFVTTQVQQTAAAAGAQAGAAAVINLQIGPAAVTYLAALPAQMPAQPGQLWWDGNTLAMS